MPAIGMVIVSLWVDFAISIGLLGDHRFWGEVAPLNTPRATKRVEKSTNAVVRPKKAKFIFFLIRTECYRCLFGHLREKMIGIASTFIEAR